MTVHATPSQNRKAGPRTKAAFSISAAALTLLLAGCGAGGGGEQAAPEEGSLTVLVEAGGKAELTPVAEKYTEETGTEITFTLPL